MTDIRTPEDEVDKPGWFTAPFKEGWTYHGATYPSHSSYSVDWNRRTPSGAWLDDTGDPVLAIAPGTVTEVDKAEGLVMVRHAGGYSSEYRHMTGIPVKVGQKVERSDRLGSIGNVAGSGASFGAHLHHVHYKNGKRIKMAFEDKPIRTSVGDSDTRPEGWTPPAPVALQGPPPKATWQSAYREAAAALAKSETAREDWREKSALFKDERDQARAEAAANMQGWEDATDALLATRSELAACKAATPPDCTTALAEQKASLMAAVRNGVGALVDGLEAEG